MTPRIQEIDIDKLIVDHDVQRLVERVRVDALVKKLRLDALGVIAVSRRNDGTYHVIDGQHRVAAMVAAGYGDKTMTAEVYEGLSLSDEAAMFRWRNNTRQVSPLDKFRVRVVEGDEVAVALNAILEDHGWQAKQGKSDGSFTAVAALERVYTGKLNGPGTTAGVCATLMRVITDAWGHDTNGARGEIVGGIGAVLLRYNTKVDKVKLIQELATLKAGPRGLVSKGRGLRDFRGGLLSDAIAEVIVEILNRGRRTQRLPEWRSAG